MLEKLKQELNVCLMKVFDETQNLDGHLCLDINFDAQTEWMQITPDCLNMYWPDSREPNATLMAIPGMGQMTQVGFEPGMYTTYNFLDHDIPTVIHSILKITELVYEIDVEETRAILNLQDLS